MDTFIKVLECWVPNRERTLLEFGGGLAGDKPQFAAASRKMVFGRGEGLPGKAWETGHPVVLPNLDGTLYRRNEVARAAGLSGGVAIPIYAGDFLTSVFVIMCGDDGRHAGAIELWRMTPASWPDIVLVDGYYGTTDKSFELASRRTAFRKGSGLPGLVWETGSPILLDEVDNPDNFLRAQFAARAGLKRALGLPCNAGRHSVCVMTFLSDPRRPLARRMELWAPNGTHRRLVRMDGYCVSQGRLQPDGGQVALERGQSAIGRAADTGIPAFSEYAVDEAASLSEEREAAGLSALAAVPLIRDGSLYGIVAWYF